MYTERSVVWARDRQLVINIDRLYTLWIPCHTLFDEATFYFNETVQSETSTDIWHILLLSFSL